jgi:uncharacterized membrane protein YdjX (TVP38/TMEM64 family)
VILSALLSFGIGHRLGHQTVRRLAGSRLEQLSQRLARQGLLTVIAVRIIPVAPFTVINLIAGVRLSACATFSWEQWQVCCLGFSASPSSWIRLAPRSDIPRPPAYWYW